MTNKINLEDVINIVKDPFFIKDNDHKIIVANNAFYDIFGLTKELVIGKTLAENVPENERENFLKVDRNVLDTGVEDFREESLTVGGITRTIETKKMRYVDELGKNFLVGSIHDITEYKLLNDTLSKEKEVLNKKNQELEKMNRLMVGRELEMVELKKEIIKLKEGK